MQSKDFLHKLIAKTDYNTSHARLPQSNGLQNMSPPGTIQRMKIYQNNMQKIYSACTAGNPQEGLNKKKNGYGNRKTLVMQKVKNLYKKKDMTEQNQSYKTNVISHQIPTLISREGIYISHASGFHQKHPHKFQTSYLKSEADSPIKYFPKRSESAGGFIREVSEYNRKHLERPDSSHKKQQLRSTSESGQRTLVMDKLVLCRRPENRKKQTNKIQLLSKEEDAESRFSEKIKGRNSRIKNQSKVLKKKNHQTVKYTPIPKISSKSYIICQKVENKQELKIHLAFKSKIRMEVASLTKIMTSILGLQLCQKYHIDPKTQKVRIGYFESNIGGTSAQIQKGDVYTLWDLLHGLMLPSGNDASLAIAVWGGKTLNSNKENASSPKLCDKSKKQCYQRFIQQMNKKAKALQLMKTTYANSHGLVNCINRSCAHDIAVLSEYAMRNPHFKAIVSCKIYQTKIQVFRKKNIQEEVEKFQNQHVSSEKSYESSCGEEYCSEVEKVNKKPVGKKLKENQNQEYVKIGEREVAWENTHKLLQSFPEEYIGIKTGVTTAAGPCLSSCVLTECGRKFFIVVLNCKKLATRFKETQQLKKWVYKQQDIKRKNKNGGESNRLTSAFSQAYFSAEQEGNQVYGPEVD